MDPEGLLLQNLDAINRIIAFTCRRHRLDGADADDFGGSVRLRLVENDYAVLRSFQGRSSFTTYITVVIQRLLLDYRVHQWGKWRASAEGQRLGEMATRVEKLLHRDGCSFDEILQILQIDARQLQDMIDRLPAREPRRRMVEIEQAESIASPTADPHESALDGEREKTASRVSTVVRRFIDALPDEERLLLQLRFDSEMSVAQIARSMRLGQKPLYRRMEKHLGALRSELEREGIDRRAIEDLIGARGAVLDFQLRNAAGRPSNHSGGAVAAGQKEIPR